MTGREAKASIRVQVVHDDRMLFQLYARDGLALPAHISPFGAEDAAAKANLRPQVDAATEFRQMARRFGMSFDEVRPRVVVSFPQNPNDMLLSGTLANGWNDLDAGKPAEKSDTTAR